jgi:hypothetical protein
MIEEAHLLDGPVTRPLPQHELLRYPAIILGPSNAEVAEPTQLEHFS